MLLSDPRLAAWKGGLLCLVRFPVGRVMRRWFIRGFVGLLLAAVAVVTAASLLDTTERPPSFPPPGYQVTEMTASGRDGPVRLHLWYPTESDAAPVLVAQNALFSLGAIIIALAGEDNICSDCGLRDRGVVHDAQRTLIANFLMGALDVRTGGG